MFGFVDSSAVDEVRMDDNLGSSYKPKECAFWIRPIQFSSIGKEKADIKFDQKWKGADCKDGDRIRMTFDFVKKTCLVHYNDEVVGNISEKLPNQIYIVANPCIGMTMETTKFQVTTNM